MLKVNEQYIKYLISHIGETGNRVAFSSAETQAKIRLIAEMKKLNMDVYTDEAGNIIGFFYSSNDAQQNGVDIPTIGIGSHIDSVPEGGNYDGLVGIVSGMAVVKAIKDQGIKINENIAVIAFECEESSVFGKGCLGSKYMSGTMDIDTLRQSTIISSHFDSGLGITYGQKLDECNKYLQLPLLENKMRFKAFFEPHIEQGPALVDSGNKIGIVSSIAAPARTKFTLIGKGGHDGTIPMEKRRDALVGFNELYNIYRGLRHELRIKDRLRTNIGVLDIEGASVNRIPGKLSTTVSARSLDEDLMKEFMDELITRVDWKVRQLDVLVQAERLEMGTPVHLNPLLVDEVRRNASDYPTMEMWSGAGHDSAYINDISEEGAVVFFIPNTGISHETSEFASIEDISIGANVLGSIIANRV